MSVIFSANDSLLELKRKYEEVYESDNEQVKLRKFDTRAYLATLITDDQSDEDVAADEEKMKVGLKKIDGWLATHPIAANSVTKYLEPRPWSSSIIVSIVEYQRNWVRDGEFDIWLESWCNAFAEGWHDNDDDKIPDLNNYWERCECVLKLIFSRLTLTKGLKKEIDKMVQLYTDDFASMEPDDSLEGENQPIVRLVDCLAKNAKKLMK